MLGRIDALMAAGEHRDGAGCEAGAVGGGVDAARQAGDDAVAGFAQIARQALANLTPAAEALREPTMATSGRVRIAQLAAHGQKRRRIVDHLQARRIIGLAERDEGDAARLARPSIRRRRLRRADARRAGGAAAAGERRQRIERGARAAVIIDQIAEGARADIVAADQAQPVEPLLLAQFHPLSPMPAPDQCPRPRYQTYDRWSPPARTKSNVAKSAARPAHLARLRSAQPLPVVADGGRGGKWPDGAFRVVLIKPSHYDRDGYVIQWWRSTLPSNSLASVYGLVEECARDRVLGPDVDIEIEACDECNTVVDVKGVAKRIRAAGGGMVGLIGVQSNQYPRALDLGRQFRALGLPVVMGGFHVSGCIAMLPKLPADLQEALDLGIHLFAGEAEGRMAQVLRDIAQGTAPPIYNFINDLPEMAAAVVPILPREVVTRVAGHYSSFDAGRGCPFQCSFCTIINVQGRKSRYRTPDDVEAIVRGNAAQGITRFFVTDDNFARNRNWEPILDRLIELREREKFNIKILLQVDTLCHRIPGFIEKAARAGCNAVFIGLENINPESLMGTKKRQNKIWEYREMLLAWRAQKVMTYAGYILGFPTDTPESIARDIEIIKKELPIDLLEFFYLTPLPGSEDHKKLYMAGVAMEPDMNKYDLEHACTAHPRMSKEEWQQVYADAWSALLQRRACRDDHAAGARLRHQQEQDPRRAHHLFRLVAHRRRASAAIRLPPPQNPHPAPLRHANRQSAAVLSVAGVRLAQGGGAMAAAASGAIAA